MWPLVLQTLLPSELLPGFCLIKGTDLFPAESISAGCPRVKLYFSSSRYVICLPRTVVRVKVNQTVYDTNQHTPWECYIKLVSVCVCVCISACTLQFWHRLGGQIQRYSNTEAETGTSRSSWSSQSEPHGEILFQKRTVFSQFSSTLQLNHYVVQTSLQCTR